MWKLYKRPSLNIKDIRRWKTFILRSLFVPYYSLGQFGQAIQVIWAAGLSPHVLSLPSSASLDRVASLSLSDQPASQPRLVQVALNWWGGQSGLKNIEVISELKSFNLILKVIIVATKKGLKDLCYVFERFLLKTVREYIQNALTL